MRRISRMRSEIFLVLASSAAGLLVTPQRSTASRRTAVTMCDPAAPAYWQGKKCLLTGASSGLGAALAVELSRRGASVLLAARREDRLAAVANSVAETGLAQPPVMCLDVCDVDALPAKAAEAETVLGGVDVLLCCAGIGQRTSAVETDAEAHRQIMATNFEGSVSLTRALLPQMLERRDGHVVVVSSVQGFFGQPYRSSYAASKAAVFAYYDALRAEVASHGVRVTTVAPGYIATEHAASAVGGDGKPDENALKGVPPEELAAEIADAVAQGSPQLISAPLNARVAVWLRACWPAALFRYMASKA